MTAQRNPTTLPAPSAAGTVEATLASNGRALTLRRGQRLHVVLAANWTAPRAGASRPSETAGLQPLRRDHARGSPAGSAAATFTATRSGVAVVTAQTDYACFHTTPRCLRPTQTFSVTVHVLAPPGQGAGPLPRLGAS